VRGATSPLIRCMWARFNARTKQALQRKGTSRTRRSRRLACVANRTMWGATVEVLRSHVLQTLHDLRCIRPPPPPNGPLAAVPSGRHDGYPPPSPHAHMHRSRRPADCFCRPCRHVHCCCDLFCSTDIPHIVQYCNAARISWYTPSY
jgi:hypothetical protein